jgi:ADP-ribosylglycohydrolase
VNREAIQELIRKWRGVSNPSAQIDDDWSTELQVRMATTSPDNQFQWDDIRKRVEARETRNPGKTTLAALRSKAVSTLEAPPNTSKGSGTLARIAPVGLIAQDPFGLGCELAVITHGHPTGYLAAGAFALIVGELLNGASMPAAIHAALVALESRDGHEETARAVRRASEYAFTRPATAETVEAMGKGWMADEALAIALFCALVARDFEDGVSLAVNHGGDSDATGSLTGQLIGVQRGRGAVPERRIRALKERWLMETVAEDLYRHFYDRPPENLPLDAGFDPYGLQEPIEPERYPPN